MNKSGPESSEHAAKAVKRSASQLEERPSGRNLIPARKLLYTQVHDILQKRILDGTMAEGAFLANEFDLSREFQVSIGTVRKAIDMLVEDDLVTRQQGRGTTITDKRWSRNRSRVNRFHTGHNQPVTSWQVEELEYRKMPAPQYVAKRLGIADGDLVHYIHRKRSAENAWKISERLFIPGAALEVGELELSDRLSIAGLIRRYGLLIGAIDERVSLDNAGRMIADVLAIDASQPMLRLERLIHDKNGGPFEFRVTHCLPLNGAHWTISD